jgi:hypothetical protein
MPDFEIAHTPKEGATGQTHPVGAPVSLPSPTADSKQQVPAGVDQVEKFNVSTDTNGGG